MIYGLIYFEFFKIGFLAFGGGLATIPFLYQLADKYNWFTYDEIVKMVAISEATPGPLGVNMATYSGFQTAGIFGGICATLGVITPAIIITALVIKYLLKYKKNSRVNFVFKFLHPMVVGFLALVVYQLIVVTIINLNAPSWKLFIDFHQLTLLGILLIIIYRFNPYPIFIIALSGIAGFFL